MRIPVCVEDRKSCNCICLRTARRQVSSKGRYSSPERIKRRRKLSVNSYRDFNSRIGTFENPDFDTAQQLKYEPIRKSKDITVNDNGKLLINFIIKSDLHIWNGTSKSDVDGEYTFSNHNGQSVIDLCLMSTNIVHKFEDFEVGRFCNTNHFPVILRAKTNRIEHVGIRPIAEITRITWNADKYSMFQEGLDFELNVSS